MELLELRMMELVVLTGAIRGAKLQSNRRYQQINTQLRGRIPSCRSTNSVRALKGKSITFHRLVHLKLHLQPCSLTIKGSWLLWTRIAKPVISPLMPVLYVTTTTTSTTSITTTTTSSCRRAAAMICPTPLLPS